MCGEKVLLKNSPAFSHTMPPKVDPTQDDDYVAPKDDAERKALEYEDAHEHERGGKDKQGDQHHVKPSAARNTQ